MGCSSGVVEELEEEEKRYQLKVNLRDEIIRLIFDNPFYKVHIKDFHKFMKNLKHLEDFNLTKDEITQKIIEKYFEEQKEMYKYIFKSVVDFTFSRLKFVFREKTIDDKLTSIIFNIIFTFSTQKQKGVKKELRIDLCELFEVLKLEIKVTDEKEKIKFKTGDFSFLVLNLIQLCSFCFLNFFCGPATLTKYSNLTEKDLDIIFSDNPKDTEFQPEKIDKTINECLSFINDIIQPDQINILILTKVLQPLGDYIKNNNDRAVFWIDSMKLIEIFDLLIDKMDYEYYIDLFFNTEDKE